MGAPTDGPPGGRDRGSVLVLVLVLIVIGSLVVVPTLSYAIAVTRHNTALSDKTSRIEAVKAGLRIALADPQALYDSAARARRWHPRRCRATR